MPALPQLELASGDWAAAAESLEARALGEVEEVGGSGSGVVTNHVGWLEKGWVAVCNEVLELKGALKGAPALHWLGVVACMDCSARA